MLNPKGNKENDNTVELGYFLVSFSPCLDIPIVEPELAPIFVIQWIPIIQELVTQRPKFVFVPFPSKAVFPFVRLRG